MLSATDVQRLSRKELAELLRDGHPLSPDGVAGFGYRGVSLGLPALIERLTWTTFQKAFVRDGGGVRGWNVRVEQRGRQAPSVPRRTRAGLPRTFGHFGVRRSEPGILLDYGTYSSALAPMARLRDPVVAVNAGSADLLLGCSYLDLGFTHVSTPSYFTLEREGVVTHVASP